MWKLSTLFYSSPKTKYCVNRQMHRLLDIMNLSTLHVNGSYCISKSKYPRIPGYSNFAGKGNSAVQQLHWPHFTFSWCCPVGYQCEIGYTWRCQQRMVVLQSALVSNEILLRVPVFAYCRPLAHTLQMHPVVVTKRASLRSVPYWKRKRSLLGGLTAMLHNST